MSWGKVVVIQGDMTDWDRRWGVRLDGEYIVTQTTDPTIPRTWNTLRDLTRWARENHLTYLEYPANLMPPVD